MIVADYGSGVVCISELKIGLLIFSIDVISVDFFRVAPSFSAYMDSKLVSVTTAGTFLRALGYKRTSESNVLSTVISALYFSSYLDGFGGFFGKIRYPWLIAACIFCNCIIFFASFYAILSYLVMFFK
jgi:hypothetical protein